MKKIFILVCLLNIVLNSFAQNWEWAIQENVKRIAVDSAGNIFITTGYTWSTTPDSIIKRFHSNGILSWQKQFSGDLLISEMVADNSGNLFIVGGFSNFSIDAHHFISLGNKDLFFGKIDSLGALLWYKTIAGPEEEEVSDMYLNKNQKIFICGNAGAGAVIGSTTFSVPEFFVARYDLNGNQELLINKPGAEGWEVSADAGGNIVVICGITDTLNFGNGNIFLPCDPGCPALNYFIAKYNSSGDLIWAKDFGIAYYTPYEHLDTDNNGNFYLSKWGRYEGFSLNKFDASGNFVWNHWIDGVYGDCNSLCIDNNGFIWLTGDIWNGPFSGQAYIWKFNSSNNLIATVPATVTASGDFITTDYNNNIYVSGTFTDTAIFGSSTLLATAGDYFLAKIKSVTNTASVSISLTIGTNPMCAGQSVTFTATPINGGTAPEFQWKVNGSNVGTNSQSFTTSSLINNQLITCVMASNLPGVTGSPAISNAIKMKVNILPATPIVGSNTPVCSGSSINLTTPAATGTYHWTGPDAFTSALQNPVRPDATTAMAGTYSLTVTSGGCTSAAGTTAVAVNAKPTVTLPANSSVCAGTFVSSTTFTSIPAGAVFTWTNSNTAIGLAASGTDNLPAFTATNSGSSEIVGVITIIPALNGCIGTSATYSITINPLPLSTFTQSANQCLSGNSFSFTNTGGTGAYSWTFDGGTPGTSTTNSPNGVTFATVGSHIITHSVTGAGGCAFTTTSTITIYDSPSALETITANTVCELSNGTVNIGVVTGGQAPFTFSFNGSGYTSMTSYTGLVAGTYSIEVKEANGCIYTTSASIINTDSIPATPVIYQNGLTLTSSSATGNQWYLNNALIPGATGQNYIVTTIGNYTVIVTANSCSSNASEPVSITALGIEEAENPYVLSIYPNPNDGFFTISFTVLKKSTYTLELKNALGQLIYKDVLIDYAGKYTEKLNLAEYGKGVYTISLTNSKNETVKKIVILPAN